MTEWLVKVYEVCRTLRIHVLEADKLNQSKETVALDIVKRHANEDANRLFEIWPDDLDRESLNRLARHLSFFQAKDISDILETDLTAVEKAAETYAIAHESEGQVGDIIALLHPMIYKHAYPHLETGHFRNAVFDGVCAIFEIMRQRSRRTDDGADIVNALFAPANPMFVFSEIETESGQSEQKGFHKILLGAYEGIRNPKAHRLTHDLTQTLTAQYLVFLSLLARRVSDAVPNPGYKVSR